MGAEDAAADTKGDHLPAEARNLLQSIAAGWEDIIDSKSMKVIPLKGAMTNEVYYIKWRTRAETPSRKVLVRIYGEGVDIFFNRDDEIRTFEFMSNFGQGPRLLGRFSTGRVEEFINARTLSASDLHDPDISALIAAKMKEFHDLDMPGSKKVIVWDRLRKWLNDAKRLASKEEANEFQLDDLEAEITLLEKELDRVDQRVGFCHNDLQYGNVMIDEVTKSITIIDYEYASYSPIAYDIANHFCEMAADYHTEQPHILDYNKYPSLEDRQWFLHIYFSSAGEQSTVVDINQLAQDVEKFTLVSHLFWGLWGIISEHVNEIDFDYLEYTRQRFKQYWLRKPALLIFSGASHDNHVNGKQGGSTVSTSAKPASLLKKVKKLLAWQGRKIRF